MTDEAKCKDHIAQHWAGTKADLDAYMTDGNERESGSDERSPFAEYALSFDYVAPSTFDNQREGYWRWGGPSDEVRFFGDPRGTVHRAEYWFLDWFDGAHIVVTDEPCVQWLWLQLVELGSVRAAYDDGVQG